jgi:hypothetical protein
VTDASRDPRRGNVTVRVCRVIARVYAREADVFEIESPAADRHSTSRAMSASHHAHARTVVPLARNASFKSPPAQSAGSGC